MLAMQEALAADLRQMAEQIGRGPNAGSVSSTDLDTEDRARTPIRLGTDENGDLLGIYGIGNYGEASYAGDD